jgi:2-polyprenyl-3-methyl-5-hydroxy-6-metoxy-1,4-benzoquinol methylase
MADISDIYDEEYYLRLPVRSGRITTIMRLLDFNGDEIVCEIGCAAGHFLAAIAECIAWGTGIDTANAAVSAAIRIKEKQGHSNIDFLRIGASEYAGASERHRQCHYVFLMDITEHIGDGDLLEILEASRKLMRDDGQLVIHTPNLEYWLERLKDRNILPQLEGHIAVRNKRQYVTLLEKAGFEIVRRRDLPHYRQPLRFIDSILLHFPLIGRLFVSRLFLVARKK